MRISITAVSFLSVLAIAVPPPPDFLTQPFGVTAPSKPARWRSLSARIIERIWSPEREVGADLSLRPDAARTRYTSASPNLARYDGDIVLRFNISTAEEASSLAEAADTLLLDIWEFSNEWVDIRLGKDFVPSLLGLLPKSLRRAHTPLLLERELKQAIYDSYPASSREDGRDAHLAAPYQDRGFSPEISSSSVETNIFFNNYQPLSVIHPWLRLLKSLFTSHVRLISIGQSYQGRDIAALRVGVHPRNAQDPKPKRRKTVLITGGLHAREWISTSTVNYIAYHLITNYGKDHRITKLLEHFDFVFIPTLNPDGYAYTWETDRLWRKSRQQTSVPFCHGIDLDRGFGFMWNEGDGHGNQCSESFPGEEPFDSVETRNLANWARNETENNNVEFVGFLDLHSYSQEILYPYSFSCDVAAPGLENLEELAIGLEKTIRISSGLIYEVMPACEGNIAARKDGSPNVRLPRIESAGGSALDWFYHTLGVRYSYQIKLRDRGTYGFLLPRENIIPTGQEIYDAVLYFASFLSETSSVEEEVSQAHGEMAADPALSLASTGGASDQVVISADPVDDDGWLQVIDLPTEEGYEWELR